jgi:hypothetical protein
MTVTHPQTAYFDEQGNPRLLRSYCVFLDFLGFRHEIRAAVASGQEDELFQRFMRTVEPEIQRIIVPSANDNLVSLPRLWDAKVFTDNVVLGYALWSGDGENEFAHALFQLHEFQLSVALQGYFVRGGWVVGKLFMNQNTVFGSALLDAYEIESEQAIYPRILLSNEMKSLVFHHMRYHMQPPQCIHLIVDDSASLMTNYLSELLVDDTVDWKRLAQHGAVVAQRLEEHAGNERVLEKYRWVAAYHNFFCNLVQNEQGFREELRVPGEFPNYGIRLLRPEDAHERGPVGNVGLIDVSEHHR